MIGAGVRLVVVAALLSACHQGASEPAAPVASALGVEWRLVSLASAPVGLGANGQPLTLLLAEEGGRASGYAGCNQFSASYALAGSALKFGPLAMTRMACADGTVLETQYTQALEGATGLRVTAAGLELLKGSSPIARFTR